jgi:hypothetical protein
MRRQNELGHGTIREEFSELTLDALKPLAALVGVPPMRKGELVEHLAQIMEDAAKVRSLYDGLADTFQKVLQEAVHSPRGILNIKAFQAKYGSTPSFGGIGRPYGNPNPPTRLRLFFPQYNVLPRDLREILLAFVPRPLPLTVATTDELPPTIQMPRIDRGPYELRREEKEVELRIRQTARAAQHDIKAVLRLIDAGEVRVGEATQRPAQAAMKAIAEVLADGDFYAETDQAGYSEDPGSDLQIQSFAWPMLVQAAGLAKPAGTRLHLTPAGRKATAMAAHEVIDLVWTKWQKTTLLDEFSRISVIKGQKSKGRGLTAVAPRRDAVVEGLEVCPPDKWIAIDELFRVLKAQSDDFTMTRDPWKLYICELQYGHFGHDAGYAWEMLQGRFVLAFLFEYAATLGLLDVAYLPPAGVRSDYRRHWGVDDFSCLSRYDGLLYVRINALGAWCLGRAEHYEAAAIPLELLFQVLANLDVVAPGQPPSPADVLFLERFAARTSESVWRLEAGKILEAVEKGMTVADLREFLEAKSQPPLPHTVDVFLNDLAHKAGQLADLGAARLIACAEPHVAQVLANDRRLRKLCQLAGDRQLVFQATDEPAVRRALRELGYVLPPPR